MRRAVAAATAVIVAGLCAPALARAALDFRTVRIPAPSTFPLAASFGTEPRVAVEPSGAIAVMWSPDGATGHATVSRSLDGGATFTHMPDIPGQLEPTTDVEIIALRSGRLVAMEEDESDFSFPTAYSDDGGRTWTASTGASVADADRPFMAAGPVDPATGRQTVYLAYQNLLSGTTVKDMFVAVSRDGGASFGAPVPVTAPGDAAFGDLQCGGSVGPAAMLANPTTGRLYVVVPTTHSDLGGCGAFASTLTQFFVPTTRIWVATSPDGAAGSWTQSLAVDDSASGQIIGMQFPDATLDRAGNVWIAYPESQRPYPDYSGAAVKARWSRPAADIWSAPLTLAPEGGPGHVLTTITAGDPGKIDVAYYTGVARASAAPAWFVTVAQSLDATTASAHVSEQRLSAVPAYTGTASELEGACQTGPGGGIIGAVACSRAADVMGRALTADCRLVLAWPTVANDAAGSAFSTNVSTQTAGPRLCGTAPAARCVSRRRFTVSVPRALHVRVRRLDVLVAGRHVATVRGTRRAIVDLRRLPRGRFRVTLVIHGVRRGRHVRLVEHRSYRTCVA